MHSVGSKQASEQASWLKKRRGELLTVPNLIRGLVRGGYLQCSLQECVSTESLEGLLSPLVCVAVSGPEQSHSLFVALHCFDINYPPAACRLMLTAGH